MPAVRRDDPVAANASRIYIRSDGNARNLTKLRSVVEISASPQQVYETLTNTGYIIKIFRDAVSVDIDPPGRSAVGQKYHLVSKAGRRKIDIFLEVTELVPDAKVVTVQRPGGIFKSFRQCTMLQERPSGTVAETTFEYELSLGYIWKVLNTVLVERLISENLNSYSTAVKELSELIPLHAEEAE
jgi:hypothetical protein